MKIRIIVFIAFALMIAMPAYAYGDPTGGMLFQMLTPLLAMLWGVWMIFANSIRRRAANFVRKFRGTDSENEVRTDQAP